MALVQPVYRGNKSSYIDTFLDRGAACFSFARFLTDELQSESHSWYLGSTLV